MRILALFLFFWPSMVLAQDLPDLPALYDVTGVAANDTLNVRNGPFAGADKIGALAPNRAGVEVLYTNGEGTWGAINVGEQTGWVSMSFLARQPGQEPGQKRPLPVSCYGTEPFWGLEMTEASVTFTDPGMDEPPLTMPMDDPIVVSWSPRGAFAAGDITGFISRESCNDGMSDRSYGWRVDFIRMGNGGSLAFSGCCTQER